MTLNKSEILEAISNMTVLELSELIKDIEKKFNVSASTEVVPTVSVKDDNINNKEEEKDEFKVILKTIGKNKVSVIKSVRELTGLGLKEAKDLVDSAPKTIKENLNKNDAESIKKKLEEFGAEIEIK